MASKGVPLLSLLDAARMVRCRHARTVPYHGTCLNLPMSTHAFGWVAVPAALLPLLLPCMHSILNIEEAGYMTAGQ